MLYSLIRPLLFRLEAERAHDLVTALLAGMEKIAPARSAMRLLYAHDDPRLLVECAGLRFANPVGLAAGFDKRGALVDALARFGFSHVEVGTVTPRPQPGNERPRMFRLPEDRALINRLGFNSPGMVQVAGNLAARGREAGDGRHQTGDGRRERGRQGDKETGDTRRETGDTRRETGDTKRETPDGRRETPDGRRERGREEERRRVLAPLVVGVNIGKNRATPLERAAEDYAAAFVALAPLADYVTVNISSPNTPGLRLLHEQTALAELLGELAALNGRLLAPRPVFLKVSPDETPEQLDQVARAALDNGVAGFVAGNTTLSRERLRGAARGEAGGLSGHPLRERARRTIARLYATTGGRVPIIGVGGVMSADDAYGHIRAGATLLQIYSGLVYHGPGLARDINRGLAALLQRDGFAKISQAVGVDRT